MAWGDKGVSRFVNKEGYLKFGKYRGETVDDMAERDPRYMRWVLSDIEDLDEEARDRIENALICAGERIE